MQALIEEDERRQKGAQKSGKQAKRKAQGKKAKQKARKRASEAGGPSSKLDADAEPEPEPEKETQPVRFNGIQLSLHQGSMLTGWGPSNNCGCRAVGPLPVSQLSIYCPSTKPAAVAHPTPIFLCGIRTLYIVMLSKLSNMTDEG